MKKIIYVFIGFIFFLIFMTVVTLIDTPNDVDDVDVRRTISVGKKIAEDVVVSRNGIYGVDFVRCGQIRIEKIKRGPFAFGAFNRLVLDDLRVVIPIKSKKSNIDGLKSDTSTKSTAKDILQNIGVDTDFLVANGINRKFSGLLINGLNISKLDSATNIYEVIQAKKAELKIPVGLELMDVKITEDGITRSVSRAYLKSKNGSLKITWSEGAIELW